MSMCLNFTPHSWYMGFAIQKKPVARNDITDSPWTAYTENGNTYMIDELNASTLGRLKEAIRGYHLRQHNGYGERIAAERLEYLRGEIRAERISYGEIAELQSLVGYINNDGLLLQWAGARN